MSDESNAILHYANEARKLREDRDRLTAALTALEQAKKTRDAIDREFDALSVSYGAVCEDRDRLAAALEVIANGGYGDASVKARAVLASRTIGEQP